MADAIQVASDTSAETRAILDELQSEGHEIEGYPQAKQEETKEKEPVAEPKKEEPKPEPKEEAKASENETDEKPQSEKKIERTSKYVPVTKHNEERHKRQEAETRAQQAELRAKELEAKINELSTRPTSAVNNDEIHEAARELAEKHNLDGEFLQEYADKIVKIAAKKTTLPDDLRQEIEAFKQERARVQAEYLEKTQEVAFEREYSKVLEEFPMLADRKEDLKQIAFSDENVNVTLRRLALEYIHDNPEVSQHRGRKSADTSSNMSTPKADKEEAADFENMTDERFKQLSDAQVDQYLDWVKKNKR